MRTLFGLFLILLGILLGLYVGLYVCFVGGIVQVITACKMDDISGVEVALGILRFMSSALCGWFVGFTCVLPGFALMLKDHLKEN